MSVNSRHIESNATDGLQNIDSFGVLPNFESSGLNASNPQLVCLFKIAQAILLAMIGFTGSAPTLHAAMWEEGAQYCKHEVGGSAETGGHFNNSIFFWLSLNHPGGYTEISPSRTLFQQLQGKREGAAISSNMSPCAFG